MSSDCWPTRLLVFNFFFLVVILCHVALPPLFTESQERDLLLGDPNWGSPWGPTPRYSLPGCTLGNYSLTRSQGVRSYLSCQRCLGYFFTGGHPVPTDRVVPTPLSSETVILEGDPRTSLLTRYNGQENTETKEQSLVRQKNSGLVRLTASLMYEGGVQSDGHKFRVEVVSGHRSPFVGVERFGTEGVNILSLPLS